MSSSVHNKSCYPVKCFVTYLALIRFLSFCVEDYAYEQMSGWIILMHMGFPL